MNNTTNETTITVTFTPTEEYAINYNSASQTFIITKVDPRSANEVTLIPSPSPATFVYNGSVQVPTYTVKDGAGNSNTCNVCVESSKVEYDVPLNLNGTSKKFAVIVVSLT